MTKVQLEVMLVLLSVIIELPIVRKKKGTTKCDKSTDKCDVVIV